CTGYIASGISVIFEPVQSRFSHHRKIKCNNRDERNAKQKNIFNSTGEKPGGKCRLCADE
ncbi:hypothetical protein, partial [Escherichia coli]|uniref:hypothetical protein n=1 Tax=Escherichia coli TaxID=562 RepID=UPI001BC8A689